MNTVSSTPNPTTVNDPNADYFLAGQNSALKSNANLTTIEAGLHQVYSQFLTLQTGLTEQRLEQYESEINQHSKDINQIRIECERQKGTEELKVVQKNVVQQELTQIQTGIKAVESKNSMEVAIGTLLVIMLTLYLYTYYLTVGNSVFIGGTRWPAIPNFAKLSFGESAVVTLFPIFIICIGYLIHVFERNKRLVATILAVTLIIDIVFAYLIAKREYDNALNLEVWKPSMALGESTFYVIVLAGFGGYLVWGLLLNYVIKGWHEMQPDTAKKVEVARLTQEIVTLTDEIARLHGELSVTNDRIENLSNKKAELQRKVNRLRGGSVIVDTAALSSMVGRFMDGWSSYISFKWALWADIVTEKINDANQAADDWRTNIISNLDQ